MEREGQIEIRNQRLQQKRSEEKLKEAKIRRSMSPYLNFYIDQAQMI